MRNYKKEFEGRVAFIRKVLAESGAAGIVFGNSGGKDSALVGILCKAACENTVGVILPCSSKRNFSEDADDAKTVANQYGIETRTVALSGVRDAAIHSLESVTKLSQAALVNIAPRLRMMTLYAMEAGKFVPNIKRTVCIYSILCKDISKSLLVKDGFDVSLKNQSNLQ